MHIKDRLFIITGACGGLGQAISRALFAEQAKLALVDRDGAKTQAFGRCLSTDKKRVAVYPADVTKEADVGTMVEEIADFFGHIDGLINGAGILRDGLLVKVKAEKVVGRMSLEQWQSVIDVNLTGTFLCGRDVSAKMIALNNSGIIINISSLARSGNLGQSNYAASKAGVVALTNTWAKELSRFGIRCCALAPGVIDTEMTRNIKPEVREKLCAKIPAGRVGEADEVAASVIYMIKNSYFSGRVLELDGGLRF